jgi:hypothetical protein
LGLDAIFICGDQTLNAKTITSKAKTAIGDTVDKLSDMMGLGSKPKRRAKRRPKTATAMAKSAVKRGKTAARRKTAQVKRTVKRVAKKATSRARRAVSGR